MSGIRVGVAGLRFGAEFVPLYLGHPDVASVAICDADPGMLARTAEAHGIAGDATFGSVDDLLAADVVDAVHIATPVRFHVEQSLAVLSAGKHCACAVPMATDLDGIRRILAAQRAAGTTYMMMETMVFGREYFYTRDLYERGELGPLSYLRGMHLQNLDGFPRYWYGYPPLTYATHALSPLLALSGARVTKAHALGSGRLAPDRTGDFDNPFPTETALFRLDRDDLAAEVTVSFFQLGRAYQEGFCVYGQEAGVEWPQVSEDEGLAVFRLDPQSPERRGRGSRLERVRPPHRFDLLPPELRVDSGHSGAHPHLVHEFVRSIVEGRPPLVDAVTAATWTAPGIVGHASAMRGGEPLDVPDFSATRADAS
jgi:predicted dehydrogenase